MSTGVTSHAQTRAAAVPKRVVAAVALGTVLNPLNSSMVAVALVSIARSFSLSVPEATWVVSAFYLTATVFQPLMGRFADQFGARRMFAIGMGFALVAGVGGWAAQEFWQVLVARVLLSVGTSAAFPSAVGIIHRICHERQVSPASSLATISVANSAGLAVGPVIGGILIALGGWPATFAVNVPLTLAAMVGLLVLVPRDVPHAAVSVAGFIRGADPVGVLLFTATTTLLLLTASSVEVGMNWLLLLGCLAALVAFVVFERRRRDPFVDLRLLLRRRGLGEVYAKFIVFNLIYYCALYGVPQWLETTLGLHAREAGLLMLPMAALGALGTPAAAALIKARGANPAFVLGAAAAVVGSLGALFFDVHLALVLICLVCAFLGIPYALVNLSLQISMYDVAGEGRAAQAAGLFQTSRYLGAILATGVLGVVFSAGVTTHGIRVVAVVMSCCAGFLLLWGALTAVADRRV